MSLILRGFGVAPFGAALWGLGPLPPPTPRRDLRRSLVAALRADAGVAAAVGTNLYHAVVPQGRGKLPAVTYQVLTAPRDHDLDGPTGTAEARVQLAAVARDLTACLAAAATLRTLLDGFSGELSGPGGALVDETDLDNETDLHEPPADGSGRWTYRVVLDYLFLCRD